MRGWFVRRRTPVPSAFIAKISRLPARPLQKASCLPSGDQLGLLSGATSLVSRRTFLPSASTAYSSWLPSRVLTQTTCLPSGDQRGDSSNALFGTSTLGRSEEHT